MEKLIITTALTGAETTKEQNPNLPITPQEIAQSAYEAYKAGSSLIHLHVRDKVGKPTQSVEVFKEAIDLIKEKCDVIVQVSTGGAVGMTAEERIQPVTLSPEMATLSTGTVNFGDGVFTNPPDFIELFAKRMKEYGVKPEIEVFEQGMIYNALRLVRQGLADMPLHFDFVLGVPGGMTGHPRDLIYLVETIPADCTWTVAGVGRYELTLASMAIIMGGHVRVGFEDNIFYKRGELAKSNAQLVERVVRLAKEFGREIATPDEAREILNLKK